jgi:hypothetical protein
MRKAANSSAAYLRLLLGRTGKELGPCQRARKTLLTPSCNPLHHQVLPAMHYERAWQRLYPLVLSPEARQHFRARTVVRKRRNCSCQQTSPSKWRPSGASMVRRLSFLPEPTRKHALAHLVSRSIHFSTCAGRHSSSACNKSAGDSRANTSSRFSGFKNRSPTAWSNIRSSGV